MNAPESRNTGPVVADPLWVLIGAGGFVGKALLAQLAKRPVIRIRLLGHRTEIVPSSGRVEIVKGDLLRPESLNRLFEPGCLVINLAYLAGKSPAENLAAMRNLGTACRDSGVRRLLHCSTAVVAGATGGWVVDENTPCRPVSEYEKNKLEIENLLLSLASGVFEISILRPTAVFGAGGRNLLKMANDLNREKMVVNYLKSCLSGRRSLNLVCLDNVVASLLFLADYPAGRDRQVFIVSDDDSPLNHYRAVESRLRARLGNIPYPLPVILLPLFFLRLLLRLVGRPTPDPAVKFSDAKLVGAGFRKTKTLSEGLDDFAEWYLRSSKAAGKKVAG